MASTNPPGPTGPDPASGHPKLHRAKGQLLRLAGYTTADRHVEAAGLAEMRTGRHPTVDEVAVVEHEVNERYDEAYSEPFEVPTPMPAHVEDLREA